MTFAAPEHYRVRTGRFATTAKDGNNGLFMVERLLVICSDGEGWEHVSVSLPDRCPTWEEMDRIKRLFWGEDACVVQFHPPRSQYVSHHPFCLHLWRESGKDAKLPPSWMVGPRDGQTVTEALAEAERDMGAAP